MTRSNCTPRRASSGNTSPALPSRPTEIPLPSLGRTLHAVHRVVEIVGHLVQVARLQPPLDAVRVDLDVEAGRAGQGRGQRLRAAHAAQAGGEDRAAGEVRRAPVLLAGGRERLERALEDPLRADVDPRAGRSSGRTSSGPRPPSRRNSSQVAQRGTSSELAISTRGAPGCVRKTPTGLPLWTSSVSSSLQVAGASRRSPAARRGCGPPCPSRRRRPALVGSLRDLGVEVVAEHPQRGLLVPAHGSAARCRAARGRRRGRRPVTRPATSGPSLPRLHATTRRRGQTPLLRRLIASGDGRGAGHGRHQGHRPGVRPGAAPAGARGGRLRARRG